MNASGNGTVCKVLLVEDHADTANVLIRLLRRMGYQADRAGTVSEARVKARADWPDVMIVDLVLPDGRGEELVRDLSAVRPVRAIAFSGLGMPGDRAATARAGFAAHVTKPATIDELGAALRTVCAGAGN